MSRFFLNITEEDAQGLAELAQHDLALARDFSRRAQAAADDDEASRLPRALRATLTLENGTQLKIVG